MKFISWNVNGLRAVIKKGFYEFVENYNPDILCLQEIKANKEQVELKLDSHPYQYWNSAEKKDIQEHQFFLKQSRLMKFTGLE